MLEKFLWRLTGERPLSFGVVEDYCHIFEEALGQMRSLLEKPLVSIDAERS